MKTIEERAAEIIRDCDTNDMGRTRTAIVAALSEVARDQREACAAEADRFLEKLKGRGNERADGAFVAITRLVKSIRAVKAGE